MISDMRRFLIIPAMLALCGCAANPQIIDVKAICLPMPVYSQDFQTKLADEIAALSANGKFPATLTALGDYHAARKVNETCQDKK